MTRDQLHTWLQAHVPAWLRRIKPPFYEMLAGLIVLPLLLFCLVLHAPSGLALVAYLIGIVGWEWIFPPLKWSDIASRAVGGVIVYALVRAVT